MTIVYSPYRPKRAPRKRHKQPPLAQIIVEIAKPQRRLAYYRPDNRRTGDYDEAGALSHMGEGTRRRWGGGA